MESHSTRDSPTLRYNSAFTIDLNLVDYFMSTRAAELVISASWIIPVVPAGRTLENCSLIVNQGCIEDIVPQSEWARRYHTEQHIELPGHALIPGFINAHGHAAMSLLRGYADDLPLMPWLEEHIWPAEQTWVDEDFVRDGTELAVAEMLQSGTTCFADMYFFPEAAADVVHNSGMRAQIAFPILQFPTAWGSGPDEYFAKGLTLRDNYRSHNRINIAFGPHAPYTVDDESFRKVAILSEELQAPIHIHLHETEFEVSSALENTNERPIERLARLGVLTPLTQCVHMTQVNDSDLELLKSNGAQVVHCPNSNLKLASGFCPVDALLTESINVAIGTDGAASNNGLNMLEEMKQSALLAKAISKDASALSADKALELATLGGAKALGIDSITGSLEKGKAADICAIDLSALSLQPIYNPISQIVYANQNAKVSNVWVDGKQLVKQGALTTLNEDRIRENTMQWQQKLSEGK